MKKSMIFVLAVLLCSIAGGCQGSKGDGGETKADSVEVKADTLTAEFPRGKDAICYGQRPPSAKVLVSFTKLPP